MTRKRKGFNQSGQPDVIVPLSARLEPTTDDPRIDIVVWIVLGLLLLTGLSAWWGYARVEDLRQEVELYRSLQRLSDQITVTTGNQLDALATHLGLALVYEDAQTTAGRWVVRPVEALSDGCATQPDPKRCREDIAALEQIYGGGSGTITPAPEPACFDPVEQTVIPCPEAAE